MLKQTQTHKVLKNTEKVKELELIYEENFLKSDLRPNYLEFKWY